MSISFSHIPASLRVPLFYAEMDNSAANIGSQTLNTLLMGQMLPTGSAVPDVVIPVSDPNSAIALFGQGSMLARMVQVYRNQDSGSCNLWCLPLRDGVEGSYASGSITLSGIASVAGTIALYFAGQVVYVAVQQGDAADRIATSMAMMINTDADLPVTATTGLPPGSIQPNYPVMQGNTPAIASSTPSALVRLRCRWPGLTGNEITLQDSFLGWTAGESIPSGITLMYSGPTLSGGTMDPVLNNTAISAMGDTPFDFIIHPYAQAMALDALQLELNDNTGRWSYVRQIYGHAYTARRGRLSDLVAFGATRNDQHHTIAAMDEACPHPAWEYAAAYGGANAVDIANDPARPTQTTPLYGILAPPAGKSFLFEERQSLLNFGLATSFVSGGQLCVERAITTYQQNAFGVSDTSYLDSETLHTSAYVLRALKSVITSKYPRHKLADDGTRFAAGQAIVTPSVIKGELCAIYGDLEYQGIVENLDTFKKYLIVERDSNDPNRLNVLFPPDYVNQLRVFAVLNQFRLQYPVSQIVP